MEWGRGIWIDGRGNVLLKLDIGDVNELLVRFGINGDWWLFIGFDKDKVGFEFLCLYMLLKRFGVILVGGLNFDLVCVVGFDGNLNGKGKGGEDIVLFGISVFVSLLLFGNKEVICCEVGLGILVGGELIRGRWLSGMIFFGCFE